MLGFVHFAPDALGAEEILRDKMGFPRCYQDSKSKKNYFFSWQTKLLTRDVYVFASTDYSCSHYRTVIKKNTLDWEKFKDDFKKILPFELMNELKQISENTKSFRSDFDAEAFIEKNQITDYTLELNRELTDQFGAIFSAKVFEKVMEGKAGNKEFRTNLLSHLENKGNKLKDLSHLKSDVRFIVSFGLGWSEEIAKKGPYYIGNFIKDLKSMGLDITFLDRNPFGTVSGNVERLTHHLESELDDPRKIIIVSLCKGTPEILASIAQIEKKTPGAITQKLLGHVNLSGMLGGAFFSDLANEINLPLKIAKVMKAIPINAIADNARMADAVEYMTSPIIDNAVESAVETLPKNLFFINITGIPLSTFVLDQNSPMELVIRYGMKHRFVTGANDGFIELPKTLIPESLSQNQLTLVLDSSHMLSDGRIENYSLSDEQNRRILYRAIFHEILTKRM